MDNNIGEARRSYEKTLQSGKFTQKDAADFFGVREGTYAHWEQGRGKLNGEILCAVSCDDMVSSVTCCHMAWHVAGCSRGLSVLDSGFTRAGCATENPRAEGSNPPLTTIKPQVRGL